MHVDWVQSLRDQCINNHIPFFFKQWGEYGHVDNPSFIDVLMDDVIKNNRSAQYINQRVFQWVDGSISVRMGKKVTGRLLDGREWNEYPKGGSDV